MTWSILLSRCDGCGHRSGWRRLDQLRRLPDQIYSYAQNDVKWLFVLTPTMWVRLYRALIGEQVQKSVFAMWYCLRYTEMNASSAKRQVKPTPNMKPVTDETAKLATQFPNNVIVTFHLRISSRMVRSRVSGCCTETVALHGIQMIALGLSEYIWAWR